MKCPIMDLSHYLVKFSWHDIQDISEPTVQTEAQGFYIKKWIENIDHNFLFWSFIFKKINYEFELGSSACTYISIV